MTLDNNTIESIKNYFKTRPVLKASHGAIQDLEQIEIPMNFGGPTAQA